MAMTWASGRLSDVTAILLRDRSTPEDHSAAKPQAHDESPIVPNTAAAVMKPDAADQAGHHRCAGMSDKGVMTIVTRAHHVIQVDDPQVVIDATHALIGG